MCRHRWLLLLGACVLAGYSAAAPSYAAVDVSSSMTVEPAPAEPFVASYIGKTVIRTTEPLALRSAWEVNGMAGEAEPTDYAWKLDGQVVSTSPELGIPLPSAGEYAVELSYRDGLGRLYTTTVTVKVLEPAEYEARLQAVDAAAHLAVWLVDEQSYLPMVTR